VHLEGSASVAVGTPHAGAAGMARTHHEARAARRMADIFGTEAGTILQHPAVALASLVCADAAAAVNFVDTELGELGADTDSARRLRATIRVFLDEKQSPSRTAHRLGIHQNTVSYRVKRAEEMLRRPIDHRRLELEVALQLHDGLDALRAQSSSAAAGRGRAIDRP
jgi:DNA-binding PucR family transcriptional regulator